MVKVPYTTYRSKTVHTALNESDEGEKGKNEEITEVRKRGKRVMATGHDVEEALNCN